MEKIHIEHNTGIMTNLSSCLEQDVAGAEERLPLTLTSNGNTYTIDTFTPGTNKDGKTTVTITGSGYLVPFRDGRMIVPVWCSFTSGTEEYEWDGVTLNNDSFIFSFSTSKKPETVKFYAEDRQDKKIWKKFI